jgi:hypothetical protein
VRWQACVKLGGKKNLPPDKKEKVIGTLTSLLYPPNCAVVRAHAAEALGNLNAREAVSNLISALEDRHHLTRAYSVDALAKINLEDAVTSLIDKAENDEHYGVRAASVKALKKICDNSESYICIKAKAVLWDTEKRERMKKDSEELKKRVIEEGYTGRQKVG